jgi:hypothetical protein
MWAETPAIKGIFAYRKAKCASCEAMGKCLLTVKEDKDDTVAKVKRCAWNSQ